MKITNLSNTRVNILFNVKVNSDDDLSTLKQCIYSRKYNSNINSNFVQDTLS